MVYLSDRKLAVKSVRLRVSSENERLLEVSSSDEDGGNNMNRKESTSSDREPINRERQSDFGSISKDKTETELIMNKYEIWGMPLIAEFIGQLIFAFLHSMSVNTISITEGAKGSPILPAMTDGLLVTMLVISIGHISGAHVNTAVTVGVTLSGGLKYIMFPLYIIVQLLGSLAGAALALGVNGQASGAFALGPGVSIGQGVLCEIVLTFILVFAVLMTAVDQGSPIAAIAIGLAIMVDIYAGFSISGSCMNPSLSFGPAVVSGQWKNYWIYWVGPVIGGATASLVHRLALGNRDKRFFFKTNGENDDSTAMKSRSDGGEANNSFRDQEGNSRM